MKKLKKIPGGLKSVGMRNAEWDKMSKPGNESSKKAPNEQMYGGSAKAVKSALKKK